MSPSRSVLFVCLHGAAKSVLAAADFERLAAERGLAITADSAGTEPDPEIAPGVAAALQADGVDLDRRRPRRVTPPGPPRGRLAGTCGWRAGGAWPSRRTGRPVGAWPPG